MCLFTDSLEPSGVGEHMLVLATGLRADHHLAVVCPPTPAGSSLLIRARALGFATLALAVRDRSGEAPLAHWLRNWRADLFHCHAGISWEGHHGIYAAAAAGVPRMVRTEHLPFVLTDPAQRLDHRRVVERIQRVICVCDEARDTYLRAGLPAERLRVVRNGIETGRWRGRPEGASREARAAARERLGLSAPRGLVLTVGRLVPQKGYEHLLEAIPGVVDRRPNACFLWAGDGPLEADLRARARALGVGDSLRFLGRRDDVRDLYAAADLFVLPSHFEGLPLVVLEAMAAGLPVVGTRVCGTNEVVLDDVTGRLVPAGDASALTEAILEVLDDTGLAARWGEAGRERVEREFTAGRMARETAAVYEELFDETTAGIRGRRVGSRGAAAADAVASVSDGE